MDLATAQTHLAAWLQANLALASGQAYQIGEVSVTRADIYRVRQEIQYWQGIVDSFTAVAAGGTTRIALASFGDVQ